MLVIGKFFSTLINEARVRNAWMQDESGERIEDYGVERGKRPIWEN